MGWRVGQGIGPRLTYAQRKAQDAGFLDPSKEVAGDEEDLEEAKKHTYPRRDTPVLVSHRKDNFHGLGYSPGMGLNESVGYGTGAGKGPSGPNISGMCSELCIKTCFADAVACSWVWTGGAERCRRGRYRCL